MTDVYDFVESLVGHTWEVSGTKLAGQFGGSSDFKVGLNFVKRFAVGGVPDTETIDGESVVSILISSNINIRVVEIVD